MAIFKDTSTERRKPGRQARKKMRTARTKMKQIMAAKLAKNKQGKR